MEALAIAGGGQFIRERDMDREKPQFDKLLHQPYRLSAIAHLVRSGGEAPLTEIRAAVGRPSTALLCAHTRLLEAAGYVEARVSRQHRTTLVLTALGRRAFASHSAALAAMTAPREATA
jgi:DNA-binding MarR family transcriptional regulator